MNRENKLEAIKAELYKKSVAGGKFKVVGYLAKPDNRSNWKGSISLDKRLKDNELSDSDVKEVITNAAQCYVAIGLKTTMRCIDGRSVDGYDDNDIQDFNSTLGPQVPGGTAGIALGYRLAIDGSFQGSTIQEDVKKLALLTEQLGYLPGDHTDNMHAKGKTGCRAIDGVEDHLSMVNITTLNEIENIEKALLGDSFSSLALEKVALSIADLMPDSEEYFKKKDNILSELKKYNPQAAPVLKGVHKEILVVVNLVPNTTFHRDHFNALSGGKAQVFNYDLWYSLKISYDLFPEDIERRAEYIHARLALAVTALMDLTDGSLMLAVRKP